MILEKFLDRSIRVVIAGVFILIPLLFSSYLALPHELPKVYIFRALILLLSFLLIWKCLYRKQVVSLNLPKWLYFSFIGYFLCVLLGTFLSDIPELSFWGSYYRQQGFLQFSFYVLWFLALVFYLAEGTKLTKKNNVIFLLILLSVGGIFTSVHAIYTAFSEFHLRISGSLGQPNFLATYLLMVLPFVVFCFNRAKKTFISIIWGFGILLVLTAMFLTMSRAMIIGLLAAILFSIVVFRKWKILIPIGLFALGIVFLNLFGEYSFVKDNFFLGRFLLKGYGFETIQSRFFIWDSVWEMIKVRPLLGYGQEMIAYAFKPFIPVELFYYEPLGSYVDRSHNEIFDLLAQYGFIGFSFYLTFFLGTLKLAWSKVREPLVFAVFFSLVALFAANLFSFSVTINFIIWWFLMAVLLVLSGKSVILEFSRTRMYKFLEAKVVLLLFVVMGVGIYFFTVRPVLADFYFARGDYQKAVYYNPNQAFYSLHTIESKLSDAQNTEGENRENLLEEGEDLVGEFKMRFGLNFPEILLFQGKIEHLRNNFQGAVDYFELAYERIPRDRPLNLMWARSLRQLKRYDEAVIKFEEYLSLNPFWNWVDEIENKSPSDRARFLQFFENNLGFLSEMLELVETAKLAGDHGKEEKYAVHREKILEFLREEYKDV